MSGFEDLGLMPELIRAVEDMEWYLPRPVQQEVIPLILGGGHVLCAAETGSGKTGAFCLPVIQITWEALNRQVAKRSASRCVINAEDCNANCKISADGLICQCHDPRSWSGARATFGVSKGKWCYEATVEESGGIIRVGWSTQSAGLELGKDALGFGYGGTGKKSFSNNFDDYGGPFDKGDVIGAVIDFSGNGSLSFYKNGRHLGVAFTSIPASLRGTTSFHPALCIKNSQVRMEFSRLKYPPPGCQPLDEARGAEQDVIAAEFQRFRARRGLIGPTCIVIAPTLELANQIAEETDKFTKYLSNPTIKLSCVTGKRRFEDIMNELKRGANIVVATPGKLESFVDSGELELGNVRFLIIDEADRFASENFNLIVKTFQKIQSANNGQTQVCMFSATLHSEEIKTLTTQVCPNATWVDLKGKEYVPETVHHAVVWVDPKETKWTKTEYNSDGVHRNDKMQGDVYTSEGTKHMKPALLVKLIDAHKMEQGLIFCRTRIDCDLLSEFLSARGGKSRAVGRVEKGKESPYSNVVLHSGYSPAQRAENLQLFKEGYARFLICTDVAARGIDIVGLPYVINMTLPDKSEDYIHRIGRTGRSDRMGLAISIISRCREKVWFHTCPSRGEGCFNTDLAHPDARIPGKMVGGCCIWYDEPQLAIAIQQRVGHPFDELDPQTLQYHVKGEEPVTYGRSKAEDTRVQSVNVQERLGEVRGIVALEKQVQADFLTDSVALTTVLFGSK